MDCNDQKLIDQGFRFFGTLWGKLRVNHHWITRDNVCTVSDSKSTPIRV